jgi:UDP-N-acetylmuramate--alanine ligase
MTHEIDRALDSAKHIHFIGVGGSGMFALAELLHTQGYKISGSDNNEGETLDRARALGVAVTLGQRAENIGAADLIVYTAALLPENPELRAAQRSGRPVFERAALLGAVTRRYADCLCVSGTHGKTTVSCMLTQILRAAHMDPSAIIGGRLPGANSNAISGESAHLVCEACEFKDHFLLLDPDVALILNIDEDHMEYFKTLDNLKRSFTAFADMARKAVIYNNDDFNTREAVQAAKAKKQISFGRGEENDFRAVNVTNEGAFYRYDLHYHGEFLTKIRLRVPGAHNVLNSLGAIAAAMYAGASVLACEEALRDFTGAGRRFELVGEVNGAVVYDDYAHHPQELRVTLTAAKQMGCTRLWAIFQPFTYSRTATLLEDFAKTLQIADCVVVTAIMGAREINTYGVRAEDLAQKIPGAACFETFAETAAFVAENARPGDLILTLGCGDVYKVARMLTA